MGALSPVQNCRTDESAACRFLGYAKCVWQWVQKTLLRQACVVKPCQMQQSLLFSSIKKKRCAKMQGTTLFLMIIIANAVFEWAISFLLLLVHRQKKRSSVLYSGLSPLPDYLERVLSFPLLLAVRSPRSVLHLPSW